MNFKNLKLKTYYESGEDDIVNLFYIPVLSYAKQYLRLCGFFSSTSLAIASKGISKLIQNNGEMKIVTSPKLSKADINAILEGHKQMEEIVEEKMTSELDNFESEIIRDHVRALAWMIAHKKIEIKVAILKDSEGIPLDYQTTLRRGIFHQKVGILKDAQNNLISFSGSINETASGWLENIEEFKVFRSWIEGELPYLLSDLKKFKKYRFGKDGKVEVMSIPTAVKKRLIQISPSDISKLKLIETLRSRKEKVSLGAPQITLRSYQQEALQSWLDNRYNGIIEMATGTGKTYVAIECLRKLLEKTKKLAVIIVVPTVHLITQWQGDLEKSGYDDISKIFGSYSSWRGKLIEKIDNFNLGYSSKVILITTYDTFGSANFINTMKKIESDEILLIADEVHAIGSPQRQKGLLDIYGYRLGLSATPERWFDEAGTKILKDFFKGVVFRYTLKEAIRDGWLSPYKYYPIFVELEDEEFSRYVKMSKKITKIFHSIKEKEKRNEVLSKFYILRKNILKNANKKMENFEGLISKLSKERAVKHCLIYCSSSSPEQKEKAQQILNDYEILQHKFTARESAKEREKILKLFREEKYKALVAMKCLDEGVNIPSISMAIILASTTNPREFIQRRGRILRKVIGKKAVIYDFIVVPTLNPDRNAEYFELERKIIKQEILRYIEFASAALNSGEAYKKIKKLRENYIM